MSGCYKRVNFYDLCRLCAQNIQKNKAKIFEQEGTKNQLKIKIEKCLSITVTEDDFLPKVVCLKCIKQLEVCNAFREECLNSETMLSSYFKKYRHTEDFKKSGKVYIKDSIRSDVPIDTSTPLPIKTELSSKTSASTIKTNSIASPYLQKTDICPKTINNTSASASSPNKRHKIDLDSQPHNAVLSAQTMQIPFNLDALNEALKKAVLQLPKDILNKVIVNSNGEVINLAPLEPPTLDPLNLPSNVLSGLTSVIKNKYGKGRESARQDRNSIEPNIIKIDLTDDDNIQDISENKYGAIPFCKNGQNNTQSPAPTPTVIFPVPQYQNNNFTTLQNNNISYAPQTNVSMSPSTPTVINVICSNPSETHPNLNSINSSPPSSINMDDLRSTNYIQTPSQQSSISKMAVVTAEDITKKKQLPKVDDQPKVHTCEVCSKTFKRREHLYQHVKLHTGFRPYRCTECNKTFVRKEHLLRHMVLHSGERNYACDICSRSFSRHDNLLKHIRTHNKEPSYTCDVCQKVFILKHYYEAHRNEQGKCYLPPQIRAC